MNKLVHRHNLRLDEVTQVGLDELCRQLFTTKSNLMRKYIQQGVNQDIQKYAHDARQLVELIQNLKSVR